MSIFKKYLVYIPILLALGGFFDSTYLAYEHFQNVTPPCSINAILSDCGKVLKSDYAVVMGIPLAVIGMIHYTIFTLTLIIALFFKRRKAQYLAVLLSLVGFVSSLYFVYLQLVIIRSICIYCMGSALISTALFLLVQSFFSNQKKYLLIRFLGFLYKYIIKRVYFLINPETIHTLMVRAGENMGKAKVIKLFLSSVFSFSSTALKQRVLNMGFDLPIGLAAGFDYEARLTQILPSLGFGFETVGTITRSPYEGNARPLLGRLPRSKSLMVNKGFKNLGASATIRKLRGMRQFFPLGVSIGRTNSLLLTTQTQSVKDIVSSFRLFEKSKLKHSYYELNISCPNLRGDISFYPSKNLDDLLSQIDKLKLSRPLFIKMPIEQSNTDVLRMLKIIAQHSVAGVIFGNLQKDRNHPSLDPKEVAKFSVGYFSGKPTFDRSNELIKLTYKRYKNRFIIIGCGGVFSSQDAYKKIRLGATLVQLITGMIFEGPQLIAQINHELEGHLQKDGFSHISEAIGVDSHI